MLIWTGIGAYLLVNLVSYAVRVSPSFINDTSILGPAMTQMAAMLMTLILWLSFQGSQAVIACWLVFRCSPRAPAFLKAASIIILVTGFLIGFGCTEVGRRLSSAGLDGNSRDVFRQTLNLMKYLVEILTPVNAAGCVYLFRQVLVQGCFGGGGPETGASVEQSNPNPGQEPRLMFTLISALLILALYKEANTLLGLASFMWHSPDRFFFYIKINWMRYLMVFALSGASIAAATAGLAGLRKEAEGQGPLPVSLAVVTLVQLVYLGFSLYNLARFSHSKFPAVWYAGGLLALAETAGFVFVLVPLLSG